MIEFIQKYRSEILAALMTVANLVALSFVIAGAGINVPLWIAGCGIGTIAMFSRLPETR